jgi:hypothetical protein
MYERGISIASLRINVCALLRNNRIDLTLQMEGVATELLVIAN